jgi:hypothetical protein
MYNTPHLSFVIQRWLFHTAAIVKKEQSIVRKPINPNAEPVSKEKK